MVQHENKKLKTEQSELKYNK